MHYSPDKRRVRYCASHRDRALGLALFVQPEPRAFVNFLYLGLVAYDGLRMTFIIHNMNIRVVRGLENL